MIRSIFKHKYKWLTGLSVFIGVIVVVRWVIGLSAIVSLISLMSFDHNYGSNILVVGIDDVSQSKRSDAISVVHINPNESKVRVLSIPRDTRVSVEGIGITKINHAYAHGGISLLTDTVMEFLSIPIDGYVVVNTQGIRELIDIIGGVEVDIKKKMKYDDYAANLHINFDEGVQHLDGERLLHYIRFRKDSKGDIGRIERQQEVVKKLFHQIFRLKTLVVSPQLVSTFLKTVKTNVPFPKLNNYLGMLISADDQLNIRSFTVPGSVRLIKGVSYWRPNIAYLDNIIEEAFTQFSNEFVGDINASTPAVQSSSANSGTQPALSIKSKKRFITKKEIKRVGQQLLIDESQDIHAEPALKIEILNGNGYAGVATHTAAFLKKKGVPTHSIGNSQSFDYDNTLIVDWKGNLEKSLYLSKLLNIKASNIVVYDRQSKPIDVTLVLGKDWTLSHITGLSK